MGPIRNSFGGSSSSKPSSSLSSSSFLLCLSLMLSQSWSLVIPSRNSGLHHHHHFSSSSSHIPVNGGSNRGYNNKNNIDDRASVLFLSSTTATAMSSNFVQNINDNNSARKKQQQQQQQRVRNKKKFQRKRIPETEKNFYRIQRERQAEYEKIVSDAEGEIPSIWSFESLFPEPVLDKASLEKDLYGVKKRDGKVAKANEAAKRKNNDFIGTSTRIKKLTKVIEASNAAANINKDVASVVKWDPNVAKSPPTVTAFSNNTAATALNTVGDIMKEKVDPDLSRMVEDRISGFQRTPTGEYQYDISLMGDGAVKFREGVRLGKPLSVNADRLTYFARKELSRGRIEEAMETYERALAIDTGDGRPYLGLSRCAERRRDFKLAMQYLKVGIAEARSEQSDRGANPFLLQALGCLSEKRGDLSAAEANYIAAAKSRPSHAAAWVSLAQLRTRKLGRSAASGRSIYQFAELQLKKAGKPASSHVYTAWAALENKSAGDTKRARELFEMALEVDPRCSAALLQLGVMETKRKNWDEAKACFERVLKFDNRNSRVIQAYAIMETKNPDGSSRKAIELFERALKNNPKDAGVLQPYALYVAELGDIDMARDLLRRGTEVNKRHSAVWQAWGVLETRIGSAQDARNVFQQGIWACAKLAGVQSGGYHCARLWQAWGVLEAREGDLLAARRCFNRALDADSRNVPTVIAWTRMEEEDGNYLDARSIFEQALKRFASGSDSKMAIWTEYERMEQRLGYPGEAQNVFQRAMRETMGQLEVSPVTAPKDKRTDESEKKRLQPKPSNTFNDEKEAFRWGDSSSMGGEVWMSEDKTIETKIPMERMKNLNKSKKDVK